MAEQNSNYRVSRSASLDVDEIWDYIAEESVDAADNVIEDLRCVFSLIARHPLIGRKRDDIERGLRCHSHRNYSIYYFRIDTGVEIFRVLHGARDVTQIFDKAIDLPNEET